MPYEIVGKGQRVLRYAIIVEACKRVKHWLPTFDRTMPQDVQYFANERPRQQTLCHRRQILVLAGTRMHDTHHFAGETHQKLDPLDGTRMHDIQRFASEIHLDETRMHDRQCFAGEIQAKLATLSLAVACVFCSVYLENSSNVPVQLHLRQFPGSAASICTTARVGVSTDSIGP